MWGSHGFDHLVWEVFQSPCVRSFLWNSGCTVLIKIALIFMHNSLGPEPCFFDDECTILYSTQNYCLVSNTGADSTILIHGVVGGCDESVDVEVPNQNDSSGVFSRRAGRPCSLILLQSCLFLQPARIISIFIMSYNMTDDLSGRPPSPAAAK